MRAAGIAVAYLVGMFFVVGFVVELVSLDYGDASMYEDDWGGPTLVGVLAVHCLPGVVALALMIWDVRRRRRDTTPDNRGR